ncbi:putative phospholipid-transporting ATPase 5 [Asimina triloba]
MKQILITSANADADKAMKENILKQITIGSQMIRLEKDPNAAFALIIDGKTLSYALQEDVKIQFLDLAVDCASVICCRVSPKQKALVTRLVKVGTGKTTLAIGDGANDVGMIQEADIGVGISGDEGMQAVMASDFSISQFHYLERLLVIHGHWCYKRIAQMICYFFYKNIAFGLTLFYFEAYTGCTGQSIYDDWYLLLFNVLLTSLPVISLGVFEQDVPSDVCLQFPALYQQGSRNLFFDWTRILGWMIYGVFTSLIIFFLNIGIFHVQAIRTGGQTSDMAIVGATMFTSTIWTVNCQIALSMSHFTWIQHLFIWSSICMWYLFSTTLCQISQRAVHYATNLDAPMLGQFFTQPLEGERSCNGYVVLLRKKFSYLENIPGVLLPHPSSSGFPFKVDSCNPPDSWSYQGLQPHPAEYHDQFNQPLKITPSMTSLEALLSKLPPVEPAPSGSPSGYYEAPLYISSQRPLELMGMSKVAKEEADEECGHGSEMDFIGESSNSMSSYHFDVTKSSKGF